MANATSAPHSINASSTMTTMPTTATTATTTPPLAPDPIARLVIEHECRARVLLAAELIDGGRSAELARVFCADARLVRPNGAALDGCDAIVASYAARPADRISRHLVLATHFHSVTPDAATAVTQVLLWSGSQSDAPGPFGRPARGQQIVGRFDDTFARTAHGWRIATRHASFELYVDGS
ncbi:nuclear transport factor 2 family protein [Paraburkholderia acidisoli]|uniref:DUF3225 domain-containing protein n=1 Tax=Paraburkholderia acidisoli TaxID=2571748 RepID=A0A7Z2GSG5_9BURK|nr:nuclear transport factor 2 family protein [Paraburkholderia acidisoli]QGZ66769.1 DUF3225 domain-containing protein [Paraburkholderia acidisoli]